MSDRNPFKNLLKRVLKRELVTKHGMRALTAQLLQNKKEQNKGTTQSQTGHRHISKVFQTKPQQTNASSQSEHNHHHFDKPQIRIHKLKNHIEIDQTEENRDKTEKASKNKQIKKCQVKLKTLKARCNPVSGSPSSPETPTPEHKEVNSNSKKDLFTPPNLTPPVSRLRRTRGLSRVQKAIKFSEE